MSSLFANIKKLATILANFVKDNTYMQKTGKKSYEGNIPINLDYNLNFGKIAYEQCYPNLPYSWMEFLGCIRFTIEWKDEIPIIQMIFTDYSDKKRTIILCTEDTSCIILQESEFYIYDKKTLLLHILLEPLLKYFMTELNAPVFSNDEPVCLCVSTVVPKNELEDAQCIILHKL